MCLAVPMKLKSISPDGLTGEVEMSGATLEVGLELVPDARLGNYLLIHAGMAIELLEDEDAEKILETYEEYVMNMHQHSPDTNI